ncbi:hypothetical protein, partial [Rheinheimera sp.]|uniref:hypothetical protein n=1 Tax=Rheinheimera sp. TaxID=1869214 RepID=UPI0037C6A69A
ELLPQFAQETNLKNNQTTKVVTFTNQIKGISITFNTDKVHFTQDIKPEEPARREDIINNFVQLVTDCFSKVHPIYYSDKMFNRIALITTGIKPLSPQSKISFIDSLCSGLTGKRNSIELKFRVSYREQLTSSSEQVNITTMLNDGIFEKTDIRKNITTRSDCFLIQLDLNTLEENATPRFDLKSTQAVITELKQLSESQIAAIISKF